MTRVMHRGSLSQSPGVAVGIHQQPDTARDKESEAVEIHVGRTQAAPFLRPHLPNPVGGLFSFRASWEGTGLNDYVR